MAQNENQEEIAKAWVVSIGGVAQLEWQSPLGIQSLTEKDKALISACEVLIGNSDTETPNRRLMELVVKLARLCEMSILSSESTKDLECKREEQNERSE